MLISVALATGFMLLLPTLQGAGSAGLSPTEAVLLMNRQKAVVIDVCSDEEFAAGHVKGARHVPADRIDSDLSRAVSDKDKPLIMVCTSGVRARVAAVSAQKLGYTQVHCLNGGLKAWREANLPVEKA